MVAVTLCKAGEPKVTMSWRERKSTRQERTVQMRLSLAGGAIGIGRKLYSARKRQNREKAGSKKREYHVMRVSEVRLFWRYSGRHVRGGVTVLFLFESRRG